MNFHVQGEYTRKLEVLASSYHSIYNTEHSKIYDKLHICMLLNFESFKYKETFLW